MADQSRPVTGYPVPPGTNPNGNPPPVTGTAYPYQVQAPYNSYYYHNNNDPNAYNNSNDATRAAFLRRMLMIMIAFLIIIGGVMFIVWLILRPELPEFRIVNLGVAKLNASNSQITGYWDVKFLVRNPNSKMKISYDYIESFIWYTHTALSVTSVAPFEQGTKDQTDVKASFAEVGSYVNPSVVNAINGDLTRGIVRFTVQLGARVGFRAGDWHTRRRYLKVLCSNVPVGFSSTSTGTLSGGSRQCQCATRLAFFYASGIPNYSSFCFTKDLKNTSVLCQWMRRNYLLQKIWHLGFSDDLSLEIEDLLNIMN
ncbi:Late embryogenesis abundant protein, LEA_2 subgroup [Dillenia turbinata]|uniref:Late embryogenesis abundant protein, LEA_2 subgroup n=1 Tax=Dillenia turbinata TaxID=194707 RepID=A0AAN8VAE4_9MAGN